MFENTDEIWFISPEEDITLAEKHTQNKALVRGIPALFEPQLFKKKGLVHPQVVKCHI